MDVTLGLPHWGRNTDWGYFRTVSRGKHLDLKGRKWRVYREDCIMRSFITCTLHKMIKSRRMRRTVYVGTTGEVRNAHKILVGKPEGRTPLVRPRRW